MGIMNVFWCIASERENYEYKTSYFLVLVQTKKQISTFRQITLVSTKKASKYIWSLGVVNYLFKSFLVFYRLHFYTNIPVI